MRLVEYDKEAFKPHVLAFAKILYLKMREPYYGVRNQSITALSHIVKAYNEELKSVIPEIITFWFTRVQENVGTVRESAAIALISCC